VMVTSVEVPNSESNLHHLFRTDLPFLFWEPSHFNEKQMKISHDHITHIPERQSRPDDMPLAHEGVVRKPLLAEGDDIGRVRSMQLNTCGFHARAGYSRSIYKRRETGVLSLRVSFQKVREGIVDGVFQLGLATLSPFTSSPGLFTMSRSFESPRGLVGCQKGYYKGI
jgi:hypothetical protein